MRVERVRTVVAAEDKRKLAAATGAATAATGAATAGAAANDGEAVPAALQWVGAAPLETRPARASGRAAPQSGTHD